MYRVTYKGNLKPIFNHAVVDSGNGWFMVDPMRYEYYAARVEAAQKKSRQTRQKQAQRSRNYVGRSGKPQRSTKRSTGRKNRMHSKQRFLEANIAADDMGMPMTGELIQPLRGREWVSEFWVPLVQSGVTGIVVASGTGIILALSHELLSGVNAGLIEFAFIGGGAWLLRMVQHTRRLPLVDSIIEALPFGIFSGIASASYYLTVTGHWFTFGWGAALAGVAGFAGFALQWFNFMGKADELLYAIERVLGQDLNEDGDIGEPPVEPAGEREIPFNRGNEQTSVNVKNELPVNSHVWQSFAIAVLVHKCNVSKTAITKMTKEKGWKHRKISQPDYLKIYRYCEKNKYIVTDGVTGKNSVSDLGWRELSRWLPSNMQTSLPHPSL